jgi:hypothetical protein
VGPADSGWAVWRQVWVVTMELAEGGASRRRVVATAARVRRGGQGGAPVDASVDPFGDIVAPPLRDGRASSRTETRAEPRVQPSDARAPRRRASAPEAKPLAKPLPPKVSASAPADGAPAVPADAVEAVPPKPSAAPSEASPRQQVAPAAGRPARRSGAPSAAPAKSASGRAELRRAIAIGLILAAALVGAAIALRPAPEESAALAAPQLAAAAGESLRVAGVGPVAAADVSILLRLDPGTPPERRDALDAAAEAAGYGLVEHTLMPLTVARSRIEYFASEDRAAAEALARALAPLTGGQLDARSLADVSGAGEAGRIDVWIATRPQDA